MEKDIKLLENPHYKESPMDLLEDLLEEVELKELQEEFTMTLDMS